MAPALGRPIDDVRNDAIFDARQSGETWAQIAKRYGLSRERIRQIVALTRRRRRWRECCLSTRAWNVLRKAGVLLPDDTPDMISRETVIRRLENVDLAGLASVKDCGVSTVQEISALVGVEGRFRFAWRYGKKVFVRVSD